MARGLRNGPPAAKLVRLTIFRVTTPIGTLAARRRGALPKQDDRADPRGRAGARSSSSLHDARDRVRFAPSRSTGCPSRTIPHHIGSSGARRRNPWEKWRSEAVFGRRKKWRCARVLDSEDAKRSLFGGRPSTMAPLVTVVPISGAWTMAYAAEHRLSDTVYGDPRSLLPVTSGF